MNDETDTGAEDDWAAALQEQSDKKEEESASDGGEAASAEEDAGMDWGEALQEQAEASSDAPQTPKAEFEDFTGQGTGPKLGDQNLDMILDIQVTVSMEIGRTEIPIRNLLQLSQGSVVELEQLAGEPMDVLINGTLIAHGEVVVVNDRYGIRLTDVISPAERVRTLS